MRQLLAAVAACLALSAISAPTASAAAVTYSATGASAAAIQTSVDAFRTALGPLNPNTAGSAVGGRREINWDGVPDSLAAPNNLPANFFNTTSPRGVVLSTPGTGFQVSANAGVAPVEFDNLNPTYSATFGVFSSQRLFTPLGSNITDVTFFVPGSTTAATVSAFGAVFTDVDLANTTSIQFFDTSNTSLGTFFVPATSGSGSLSFLGVQFNAGERVARVRITAGNAAVGGIDSNGSPTDAVVMDDFIYAEPGLIVAVTVRSLSVTRSRAGTRVRWRTASEVDLLGFNVFRELNGRRARMNARLIRAGNTSSGHAYSWLDRATRRGMTARYWLQAVDLDGSRAWFGPVVAER